MRQPRVRFASEVYCPSHYSSSDSFTSHQCVCPPPSTFVSPSTSTSRPVRPCAASTSIGQSCVSLPTSSPADCLNVLFGPGDLTQSYPPRQHVQHHAYAEQHPCYDECDPLGSSLSLFIDPNGVVSHLPTHTKARTRLYRSNSVSIVNCEYKLREKYPHMVTLIFYMLFYFSFMVLIASLFVVFEKNEEMKIRDQILNVQQQFLERNPCVDANSLKTFVSAVLAAADKKVNLAKLNTLVDASLAKAQAMSETQQFQGAPSPDMTSEQMTQLATQIKNKAQLASDGIDSNQLGKNQAVEIDTSLPKKRPLLVPTEMANWEFSSSLIFVTTVVTTIGYGHIAPITPAGKLLAITAGAIAIPMTLLVFSILISMFRDGPIKLCEIWLIKLSAHFNLQTSLMRIRFIHLFLVTAVLFSVLILGPAFFFNWMEPEWSLLDSFYYCFITITTVGLGDLVPGQGNDISMRALYQLGIVLYMFVSLCMVLLWIALVLRIPYFNFKTFLVIEEPEIEEEKLKLLDEQEKNEMDRHSGYGSNESLVSMHELTKQTNHHQHPKHPLNSRD